MRKKLSATPWIVLIEDGKIVTLACSVAQVTRYRAAKRETSPPMAVRQGHIDGAATWQMHLKRHRLRLRCRFDHLQWPYSNADQCVRLLAWGFLLVLCSNQSPIMHGCWARHGTNRQTDGRIAARLYAPYRRRGIKPSVGLCVVT